MRQAAHRDVQLFQFHDGSSGYHGLHLRARTRAARVALKASLETVASEGTLLLKLTKTRFADPEFDHRQWARSDYQTVLVALDADHENPVADMVLAFPEGLEAVLLGLTTVAFHEETTHSVLANGAQTPLTIWWDLSP